MPRGAIRQPRQGQPVLNRKQRQYGPHRRQFSGKDQPDRRIPGGDAGDLAVMRQNGARCRIAGFGAGRGSHGQQPAVSQAHLGLSQRVPITTMIEPAHQSTDLAGRLRKVDDAPSLRALVAADIAAPRQILFHPLRAAAFKLGHNLDKAFGRTGKATGVQRQSRVIRAQVEQGLRRDIAFVHRPRSDAR